MKLFLMALLSTSILAVAEMPYQIRRSSDRKYFDHGWLTTYHTFSFGDYYDPNFMGFRDLKVINEDRIAPGKGFPLHSHKDMEIVTLILEGQLTHKDSMGHESVIQPNELQIMSAGKGIKHSEYNASQKEPVHLLQIWIQSDSKGLPPRYEEMRFSPSPNAWTLVASKSGRDHSLKIHQDVELYTLSLESGKEAEKRLLPNRYGWIQILQGEVEFNRDVLKSGDAAAIHPQTEIKLKAHTPSKILFFDLN